MFPCISSRQGIYVSALSLALLMGSSSGFTLAETPFRMRRIYPNTFPAARSAPAATTTVAAAGGVIRCRIRITKLAIGSLKSQIPYSSVAALLSQKHTCLPTVGSEIAPCRQSCFWSTACNRILFSIRMIPLAFPTPGVTTGTLC